MIDLTLECQLPPPWNNQIFTTNQVGSINFLVGPNGSGKSQFAEELVKQLRKNGTVRLLATDRLSEMHIFETAKSQWGDPFNQGFAMNQFDALRRSGTEGSGIDTILLLEERMDLLVQVEATLSHLFGREIALHWNSGNIVPTATLRGHGESYRLDRDECHGIKELLVLLTHLYDDTNQYLVIDEPELNLHPQYQAFFIEEVRRVTGTPTSEGLNRVVFLITHSPFILDLRTEEDLNSVISFDLNYSVPRQVSTSNLSLYSPNSFIRRFNAYHKQLFFADNPIFVEGIHDAWFLDAMMKARGVSVSGAGSCIIDSGGVEQVNQYLKLCIGLGKNAYFLYDLDSLFVGKLKSCVKNDKEIVSFLATSGVGGNVAKYFGQLETNLKPLIEKLRSNPLPKPIERLGQFLKDLGELKDQKWGKARVAVMTALSEHKEAIVSATSKELVDEIEGRKELVLAALMQKNIHVLPGGTLERYLPLYSGDEYELTPEAKQKAVDGEIEFLADSFTEDELKDRYEELYDVVCRLPSQSIVNVDSVLREHLSDFIHSLQLAMGKNSTWQLEQVQEYLSTKQPQYANILSVQEFERGGDNKYNVTLSIIGMMGNRKKTVRIDQDTNAAKLDFKIEEADLVDGSTQ